jgi:hypothetical protein
MGQVTPSPGSMSKVMRSGLAICDFTPFQVWNSITFICAADSSPSADTISSIAGWPGKMAGSSGTTPAIL